MDCGSMNPVLTGQQPSAQIREAERLAFRGYGQEDSPHRGECDCNSPAHWDRGTLYVFNSAGNPWRISGPDLFHLEEDHRAVEFDNRVNGGRWFEATYKGQDGTLCGWYHNEPGGVCPAKHLTAPRIGMARSADNGATWSDMGLILEARSESMRCDTPNRYFAGGNGDFSVILDEAGEYIYFLISTYGDFREQGVSVARLRYADRNDPIRNIRKWHEGEWKEPGSGGYVTPVFPALSDWHSAEPDAFWGPSVHWNTFLKRYVVLLNRANDPEWAQEGIYISFNSDLSDPKGWTTPEKLMDGGAWYPQVMGLEKDEGTDKRAGQTARLFVRGESRWEITFSGPEGG